MEKVELEDYETAKATRVGWCPGCAAFTTPGVSLLEFGLHCVECLGRRVCGAVYGARNDFFEVVS
jgi:hypothetical protein